MRCLVPSPAVAWRPKVNSCEPVQQTPAFWRFLPLKWQFIDIIVQHDFLGVDISEVVGLGRPDHLFLLHAASIHVSVRYLTMVLLAVAQCLCKKYVCCGSHKNSLA